MDPKIALSPGGSRLPTHFMVPWANLNPQPNGTSIFSVVFVGLTVMANKHTDRQTCRPQVPDLSVWRPWAGSLLFTGPYIPTLKCYNLHAFTIAIITK